MADLDDVSTPVNLPLAGIRVVDLTDDVGAMCGRLLADLGADVLLVEPPGGVRARTLKPTVDGLSLLFATQHANKRAITLDLTSAEGRHTLQELVSAADIVIDGYRPGELADLGLGPDTLRSANAGLVVTSITPFGQTGPYRDWVATDAEHFALSSVLSRSGLPGMPPLIPPGRLADEHASAQAAWATLVALWYSKRTGIGQGVDVSVLEAVTCSMDAAFGIAGSAMADLKASDLPTGRPDARHMYPIFPCADGHVRICILATRQWRCMFTWLGEPDEFSDPKYDSTIARFKDSQRLYRMIGTFFATRGRAELVAAGQRFGVPIESVKVPADVLLDEHFATRASFTTIPLPSGHAARAPRGCIEVDGHPVGIRTHAPPVAKSAADVAFLPTTTPPHTAAATPEDGSTSPLAGLRVLDLGVIVVGAETGRLFADLGADVIKIESQSFPDGSRQGNKPGRVNASVAWGHRNKRSLGIDLRSSEGNDLFKALASTSDVILSNFKPCTLESLKLGYDVLRQVNPGIVMVDSSALGSHGPASRRMGYGPLVRAATGLTSMWRYPHHADSFCDSITVYPDHTAGRIGAVGALALLLRRRRTGQGGTVSVAQAEVMLTQFAAEFALESVEPGAMTAETSAAQRDCPSGVYQCIGDDQWCVVTVRHDRDWQRLCAAIGANGLAAKALNTVDGRRAERDRIDERITEWTMQRSPDDVMATLQDASVPAAAMRRVNDLLTDAHFEARRTFGTLVQPGVGELPAELRPAAFSGFAQTPLRPAPLAGADTRVIASEVLGLAEANVDRLLALGILQEAAP